MCERPTFWRWFIQELVDLKLVDLIRAVPGFIRSPGFESSMGFIFTIVFLFYAILSELPEVTRIALALLSVPSFIIYKHGIYRWEADG